MHPTNLWWNGHRSPRVFPNVVVWPHFPQIYSRDIVSHSNTCSAWGGFPACHCKTKSHGGRCTILFAVLTLSSATLHLGWICTMNFWTWSLKLSQCFVTYCQAAWWLFLATRLRNGSSKSFKLALPRLDPTKSAGWPSSPNLLQICRKGAGVHAQRTSIVSGSGWGQKTSAQGMSLESPNFTSPIPARQSFGQKPFRNCSCTLSTKSCQGTLCSPPQSWTGMAAWPPSSHRTSETCSNIEHSPHADKMLKQVSQNALSPVSETLAFTVSYVCDMNNILRYILAKKTLVHPDIARLKEAGKKHRHKNKEPFAQTYSPKLGRHTQNLRGQWQQYRCCVWKFQGGMKFPWLL